MRSVLALSAVAGLVASAPLEKRQGVDDASRFTYYNMPTALAGPCDLANGPDGLIWGEDILTNNIFTINDTTGVVTEYPIPYTGPALPITDLPGTNGSTSNRGAFACAIRPGADGNMYAASGVRNQLVKIETATKKITVFTPPNYNPTGNLEPFNDMWTEPEGMLFSQTTANTISYFEYATETFTNYEPPTPESGPLGMFVASDGYAYFTEFIAQKIGRFNRTAGTFEEFQITDPALFGPAVIRAETPGYIWFTALVGGSMGSLCMETGEIKAYPNNYPLSLPSEDTVDDEGRVWFSTISQNSINYVDPSTGDVTNIVQPGTLLLAPVSLPFAFEVAVNYREGYIWFTNALYNTVGKYKL